MFKKHGRTVGSDVESILTRTETLLEEGNLDDAAREMNTLTGWAKTLSVDWLAEARRVLELRQALDVSCSIHRRQPGADRSTDNRDRGQAAELEGRLSISVVGVPVLSRACLPGITLYLVLYLRPHKGQA